MKKNVAMFANEKQMRCTNRLIKAGIISILGGVVTLAIGGRSFYKTVWAIQMDECTSNVINDMIEKTKLRN